MSNIIVINDIWSYLDKLSSEKSIYAVAATKEDVEGKLTKKELEKFDNYVYVSDTHFFKEFDMPKLNILFIPGWKKHQKSRVIDYDVINYAVKNNLKLINYHDGEFGHVLDKASDNKELKLHGHLPNADDKPINMIDWHPEVIHNQPEYLKPF